MKLKIINNDGMEEYIEVGFLSFLKCSFLVWLALFLCLICFLFFLGFLVG